MTMDELLKRLAAIEQTVQALYLPTPAVGVKSRALKPFHFETLDPVTVYHHPDVATAIRGLPGYTSPDLQTSGYTLHECYLQVQVIEDTVAAAQGFHDLFTAVLEGACGSAWVELATATLQSDGRRGTFMFPLLSRESLALSTRLVLYLADNATTEPPDPARQIRFALDGVLVSGPTF